MCIQCIINVFSMYIHCTFNVLLHINCFALFILSLTVLLSYPKSRDAIASKKSHLWKQFQDLIINIRNYDIYLRSEGTVWKNEKFIWIFVNIHWSFRKKSFISNHIKIILASTISLLEVNQAILAWSLVI